jgi:hypothetical protein
MQESAVQAFKVTWVELKMKPLKESRAKMAEMHQHLIQLLETH